MVRQVFDFFDKNKDGRIGSVELKEALQQTGKSVTDEEIAEMVLN